jgi:aspartate/methionine/tyrosine aminotransferase
MARDPFRYAHENWDEVVWMSQNTNHLADHPAIQEALEESIDRGEYEGYPFHEGVFGLADSVLDDLGLAGDRWRARITAGGLEGLYEATRALLEEGDEVVASDPSFLPIHDQIRMAGAEPLELPVYEDPWRLTPERVKENLGPDTGMILLVDPLNPLGTEYPEEDVRAIAEMAEDHDVPLIHDVTYRDFAYDPALATDYAPDHTLVAYSLSKNAGFAGLRVGAIVGPDHLMDRVDQYEVNVLGTNVLAQRAAKAALETKDEWLPDVVETSRANQERIEETVEDIDGAWLPVYPSSANMFLVDVGDLGVDPDEVMHKMLYDHQVFIRGGPYLSDRFGDDFVRASFSVDPEGIEAFCEAFPSVLEELSSKP